MLKDILKELGNTQEEVKNTLLKEDCKGTRYQISYCPVAVYIRKKTNKKPIVGPEVIYLDDGDTYDKVGYNPPKPVIEFIKSFDKGLYPELDLSNKK